MTEKAHDEILKEWRKRPDHDATFIEDGIVGRAWRNDESLKLLFLLKEAYLEPSGKTTADRHDLRQWIRDWVATKKPRKRRKTWTSMARWALLAHETAANGTVMPFHPDEDRAVDRLSACAVVNIKKSHGEPKLRMG